METGQKVHGTASESGLLGNPRLSDVLIQSGNKGFDVIAALPSNVHAIESSLLFSSGMQTFAAIVGPSGWGKSHLLQAAKSRLKMQLGCRNLEIFDASDWLAASNRIDPTLPLMIDNVQDILNRSKVRLQVRLLLERRVRAGRPTLLSFTSNKLTRQIRSFLPSQREWMIAQITVPSCQERMLVVRQMLACENLALSEELIKLLAVKLNGNGRTLMGALKRLKLQGHRWMTPHETIAGLGLLDPFFADNSTWDLRDYLCESAERFLADQGSPVTHRELMMYALLRIASLPEDDVARYLNVEPAQAYAQARGFERKMAECDLTSAQVHRFVERTVVELPDC